MIGGRSTVSNVYGTASTYSINTTSGKFSLSGGQLFTLKSRLNSYNVSTSPTVYCSNVFNSGTPSSNLDYFYSANTAYIKAYWQQNSTAGSPAGAKLMAYGYYRTYYPVSTYIRGTYQGQVSSSSSSAYPANARHSDGYWYTAL